MIVLGLSIHTDSKESVGLIPQLELQAELVERLSSRLREEGLDIQVTDFGHYKGPPAGVIPRNVVNLYVRADLSSAVIATKPTFIGTISIMVDRHNDTAWASRPFTFFAAETKNQVAEQARKAALEQLEASIVEPIVFQAK